MNSRKPWRIKALHMLHFMVFAGMFWNFPQPLSAQNDRLETAQELLLSGQADSAKQIIEGVLKKARSAQDLNLEVKSIERLAVWHLYTGNNQRGMELLNEGIQKASQLKDHLPRALLLGNRAYEFAQTNRFEEAIRDILEAQDIFIKQNDTLYMLNGYNAVGYIFSLSGQPEKAERYYLKELQVAQGSTYKKQLSMAYDNLAILYGETGKNGHLVKTYHSRSLAIAHEIGDLEGMTSGHSNLANYYLGQREYDSAEWHCRQALDYSDSMGYFDVQQEVQLTLSSVLMGQDRWQETVSAARKALDMSRKNGNLDHGNKSLALLSRAFDSLRQFDSAFYYLKLLKDSEDELKNAETLKNIQELETRYETSRKELLLAQQADKIRKRNVLIVVAGLMLLLLGTWFYTWRRAVSQREKLRIAEMEGLNQRYELDILNSLIEGEEKERSRIAKELHDGVNSLLAALKLNIMRDRPGNKQELAGMADTVMQEVRSISHNLMPANLMLFGLTEALRDYADRLNQSGKLYVGLQCIGMEQRLRKSVELSVYRIVQELLNNIIRHSGASEVMVQLSRQDAMLYITVEDNGKGFSPTAQGKGIGLQSLDKRVRGLNGKMEFESAEEKGTSVYIELQLAR